MPATSKSQQAVMGIAKSDPSKLYARNRGVLSMSSKQLSEFASAKRDGLPEHAPKKKRAFEFSRYR